MTFEEWDDEATASIGALPYQAEMGRFKVWRRAAWVAAQEAMRERAALTPGACILAPEEYTRWTLATTIAEMIRALPVE